MALLVIAAEAANPLKSISIAAPSEKSLKQALPSIRPIKINPSRKMSPTRFETTVMHEEYLDTAEE